MYLESANGLPHAHLIADPSAHVLHFAIGFFYRLDHIGYCDFCQENAKNFKEIMFKYLLPHKILNIIS